MRRRLARRAATIRPRPCHRVSCHNPAYKRTLKGIDQVLRGPAARVKEARVNEARVIEARVNEARVNEARANVGTVGSVLGAMLRYSS